MAATTYQWADGYDNAVGLAAPPQQPLTTTLPQWTLFTPSSGVTQRTGGGALQWIFEEIPADEVKELLDFFGLDNFGTVAKECTIRLRNDGGTTYGNYNAVIRLVEAIEHQSGKFTVVFNLNKIEVP